jgi:hypothetical protein
MASDIEIALQELSWGDMDWIGLFQDRVSWLTVLIAVMNLRLK